MSLAVLIALPLLLTPVWIRAAGLPLFSVVKVYSVCAAAVYIQALRLQASPLRNWVAWLGYLLLAVNILEAVVAGASTGAWITAAAGIVLMMAQPGPKAITTSGTAERRNVEYRLGGWWIAAYSVWNFSFVYGSIPESAAFALVHVLAPLLWSWRRPELWIQARTLALALMMILRVSYPSPPVFHETPGWHHPAVATALGIASLALACWAAYVARRCGNDPSPFWSASAWR